MNEESQLRRSVSEATARIEEVIDAAERAAESIRAEAEAEASRYLEDRRHEADRVVEERTRELDELSRVLSERARFAAEQVETLAAAVQRGVDAIRGPQAPAPPAKTPPLRLASEQPEPPGAPEPPRAPGPSEGDEPPAPGNEGRFTRGTPSEEPLLRATQMAVAGSARDEIEQALRREFGLEEPRPIVDQILGPNASAGS
jgi:hypothetical protein